MFDGASYGRTRCDNGFYLKTQQFGGKRGEVILIPFRISPLDDDVLSLDMS